MPQAGKPALFQRWAAQKKRVALCPTLARSTRSPHKAASESSSVLAVCLSALSRISCVCLLGLFLPCLNCVRLQQPFKVGGTTDGVSVPVHTDDGPSCQSQFLQCAQPQQASQESPRPSESCVSPHPHRIHPDSAVKTAQTHSIMKAGGALAALVAVSFADNSAAFVAPCSISSSSSNMFLRQPSSSATAAATTAVTMSLQDNANTARVALGTFLAGAAVLLSGGEAALADGSTSKFSLPPVGQGKDR